MTGGDRFKDPALWPRNRRYGGPKCSRCDDAGLLGLYRKIPDRRSPKGHRMVLDAFRCDCPAGNRYPNFPLPPDGP